MSALDVIDTYGRRRALRDVFAPDLAPAHPRHRREDVARYIVRRTTLGDDGPHRDVFASVDRAIARDAAKMIEARVNDGCVVVDARYSCGCRRMSGDW